MYGKEIIRHDNGEAEIVIDYYFGDMVEHHGKPIKLYGFDAMDDDTEIWEQGFMYLKALEEKIHDINNASK